MKRKLLFVTSRDGDFDQDLSYALDLAKMTDRGMAILLVKKKDLSDRFEKLMTAVTFAEAGEHDTAVEIMSQRDSKDEVTLMLEERCLASGMATAVYSAMRDATLSLKEFLKNNPDIHAAFQMILGMDLTSRLYAALARQKADETLSYLSMQQ